jgi:hypothetical protein
MEIFMDLKSGKVLAVRHFSIVSLINSTVLAVDNDLVTIKLTKGFLNKSSLSPGDPIVLGYESGDGTCFLGGNILAAVTNEGFAVVKIDKITNCENRRTRERFPVSLYADIVVHNAKSKDTVIMKNLSVYGMLVYSKSHFALNQSVEIHVYTEKDVVFIKGIILRKSQGQSYNEYGIRILYEDMKSKGFVEDYIKKLKLSYEDQIRRMKARDI